MANCKNKEKKLETFKAKLLKKKTQFIFILQESEWEKVVAN
jgi:hypothetical protein